MVAKRVWLGAGALVVLVAAAGLAWMLVGTGDGRSAPPLAGEMRTFAPAAEPEPAPDLAFTDAAGSSLTLDDFAGQVVLVNFWATWCAPCVEEMPSLDRLQARLGDRGLAVVTLSLDRDGAAPVAAFFAEHGLTHLEPYFDPTGRLMRSFEVMGLPTSVLIDEAGLVIGRYAGPAAWDSPEALALIGHYLGDGAAG
jgi:thiol-disulfide isomerase/thioredoxin